MAGDIETTALAQGDQAPPTKTRRWKWVALVVVLLLGTVIGASLGATKPWLSNAATDEHWWYHGVNSWWGRGGGELVFSISTNKYQWPAKIEAYKHTAHELNSSSYTIDHAPTRFEKGGKFYSDRVLNFTDWVGTYAFQYPDGGADIYHMPLAFSKERLANVTIWYRPARGEQAADVQEDKGEYQMYLDSNRTLIEAGVYFYYRFESPTPRWSAEFTYLYVPSEERLARGTLIAQPYWFSQK